MRPGPNYSLQAEADHGNRIVNICYGPFSKKALVPTMKRYEFSRKYKDGFHPNGCEKTMFCFELNSNSELAAGLKYRLQVRSGLTVKFLLPCAQLWITWLHSPWVGCV